MAEVKLFTIWSSPFSLRIVWALQLKGVPYETIQEDLLNKIPVLLHNGNAVVESLIILEYVDETWMENPLLLEDPLERATARFWAGYGNEKFRYVIFSLVCDFYEGFAPYWGILSEGKEQEEGIVKAKENLKYLEEELKGKKFFGGEKLGFADIALGWLAHYVSVFEDVAEMKMVTKEEFQLLSAWAVTFADVPIIKDNWPSRDKLIAKFQASRESHLSKMYQVD
ncbi:unnamed protein product [Malus baccata var. baccata]